MKRSSKTTQAGMAGSSRSGSADGPAPGAAGYSLPELLIVIALIGLMVLFGGPALAEAYRSYKVRATADLLTTDVRALRYNAVTNRTSRTLTLNNQAHASSPNQYSYVNPKGVAVTVRLEGGVNIDTTSVASVTFNNTGATGSAGIQAINVSMPVSPARGVRYTISVTPTGTVSAAQSTFTP